MNHRPLISCLDYLNNYFYIEANELGTSANQSQKAKGEGINTALE